MKKICLSIEQMWQLKELGVDTKDASMVWIFFSEEGEILEWEEVENHGKEKPFWEWYNEDTETWESAIAELFGVESSNFDHSYQGECRVFTLQDMLELMPKKLKGYDLVLFADNHIQYEKWDRVNPAKILCQFDGDNLIDTAFNMLLWLAKNGYLKGGKND